MKKGDVVFVCDQCGSESLKWAGQCPVCGAWNSMFEMKLPDESAVSKGLRSARAGALSAPVPLSSVPSPSTDEKGGADTEAVASFDPSGRLSTGIGELDRVLGGGLVPGSLTLISGEPGIGKSTMILQAASMISKNAAVLYVSGEESAHQIRDRADRICPDISPSFTLLTNTDMDTIAGVVEDISPSFLVIDSIQTMCSHKLDSLSGSIAQVRTCCHILTDIGKSFNIPVFIVAHVNKSGDLAGPKIIEHMVDCVLNFSGDRSQDMRILQAVKNRFGNTSEIGAFEMTEKGLREIKDLSARFLEENYSADGSLRASGSVLAATYEGSRPLLLEIQALTSRATQGFPRRTSLGIDNSRLSMILAVLERRCGAKLFEQDVYLNVTGGIRPEGTSADLPAALAVFSSYCDKPCPTGLLAFGEIGLTGEIRSVRGADRIVKEAGRLGICKVMLPKNQTKKMTPPKGVSLIGVSNISEAVSGLFK